jgi:hypothetical protein
MLYPVKTNLLEHAILQTEDVGGNDRVVIIA